MRLIWRIILRIALLMLIVFPLWSIFFYKAMINEVYDETDDNLELYAEELVREFLSGTRDSLQDFSTGTNNTYTIDSLADTNGEEYCQYSNETIYVSYKSEMEPARVLRMTFSDSTQRRFLITVMTPTLDTDDLVASIGRWITILFVVLLIVILLIVGFVVSRSVRPLRRLLDWIDSYRLGESSEPLDNHTDILEFERLNEAAITFSSRSEQLFEQQKQFIGNASHEIQTPIAVCQNRLELLCDTDLTEHQLCEVVKVRQRLEYISRLNKSLLLLTKIDNGQFADHTSVNVVEIVKKCVQDYSQIYAGKGFVVTAELDGLELNVTMNQTLATTLISNLIRNAFIHNSDTAEINIGIAGGTLTIINGARSGALDSEHIFQRFYRSADRQESSGLGLPIVQAIARLYQFDIKYDYIDNCHRFSIIFV